VTSAKALARSAYSRMDKKAISFFTLGLLFGVILTCGAVSFSMGSASEAGAGIAPASAATAQPSQKLELKLSHVLDESHPVHAAMQDMKKRLEQKSAGRVKLQIFPNGQLGSETDGIEQVQRGALAMVKTSAAPLEGFVEEMALFGLPYLFRDEAHYWNVLLGDIGRHLLHAGLRVGLRGLCYYDSGSRSFYTAASPIETPLDLAGKKIRVMQSRTAMDSVRQMGGSPTPIPWGELYTALQQGMVDGAENNPPSLLSSRHFEVAKHYSLSEHARIPDIILFSQKIWDTLSPEVRRWIQEAADESVSVQRKIWKQKTAEAVTLLQRAGVTIHEPDTKPFIAVVQPMYERLRGERLGKLVQRIKETR
jgi:tripartite ATP-independent transporter DctP family solute receptor